MPLRIVLLGFGTAIVALAAVLLRHDEEGWFALAVGVGVVTFCALPGRISSSRRTTGTLVVVVVVGFIAVRSAQLLRSGANSSDLVALGAETLILTVALSLLRAHLYGIGRLVSSLGQPAQELGYARILRLDEAAVVIESELARSRRRNEPLLLIELEGRADPDAGNLPVPDYVGPTALRYLEGVHLHVRLGALLSQHARRSDVVISERVGRYLLLSPETDWPGALAMSQRVAQAAEAQLRMTLKVGIACFPDDGESMRDLLTVASQRVNAAVEQATTLRAAAPMSEAERTPSETHREAVAP